MYCSVENIDTLSIEGFLPSESKSLLQQEAHNELSSLTRLTFYENLLIGQETSVRIKSVEFRENVWAFPGTNNTVRNKEVSVLSGCPVKRGSTVCSKQKGDSSFSVGFIQRLACENILFSALFAAKRRQRRRARRNGCFRRLFKDSKDNNRVIQREQLA